MNAAAGLWCCPESMNRFPRTAEVMRSKRTHADMCQTSEASGQRSWPTSEV
jgi:hypothetical protein